MIARMFVLEVAEAERRGRGRWYRRASNGRSCGYTDEPAEIGLWRGDELPAGLPDHVLPRRADAVLEELREPATQFEARINAAEGAR